MLLFINRIKKSRIKLEAKWDLDVCMHECLLVDHLFLEWTLGDLRVETRG